MTNAGRSSSGRFHTITRTAALLLTVFAALGWPHGSMPSISARGVQAAAAVFGPKHYRRTTGAPITEREAFSVGAAGAYTMRIDNGGDAGQFSRATSAIVTLNGVPIATTSDFNPTVALIERTVTLSVSNILDVELRGAPGSVFSTSAALAQPRRA